MASHQNGELPGWVEAVMGEGKCQSVVRLLRSRILRGTYPDRLPGIRQLADEMGVSTVTMGQALTQLEAIHLIERRARSGTFVVPKEKRPRSLAPMLVLLSHGIWGPTKVDPDVPYSFGQAAQEHGLSAVISSHTPTDTDKAVAEILDCLQNPAYVGACLLAQRLDTGNAVRLAGAPGPVIVADWEMPDLILPTVNHDNREGGRVAAAHLLKLGHRRIFVADPLAVSVIRNMRAEGAGDLVRQAGGTFQYVHGPEFGWGVAACVKVLDRPNRPTGIITGNHQTAADFKEAAQSLGLTVPRDLSLICMSSVTQTSAAPCTQIGFDTPGLGIAALNLVLNSTPGEEPRRVLVPPRFADHGSTAPAPSE